MKKKKGLAVVVIKKKGGVKKATGHATSVVSVSYCQEFGILKEKKKDRVFVRSKLGGTKKSGKSNVGVRSESESNIPLQKQSFTSRFFFFFENCIGVDTRG